METKAVKAHKKRNFSQITLMGLALIGLVIIMCFATDRFYQPDNIKNIFVQNAGLAIAALGEGLVMISGGFDMSIGYVISLSGCSAAVVMAGTGSAPLGFLVGCLVGLACGLVNGALVVVCKAEPFIITLGMMTVYQGLSLLVTGGKNINVDKNIGFNFGRDSIGVIPIILIALVAVYVIIYLIFKYTKFGRRAYAIGDNEEAAYLTGVKIKRNKIYMYALCGFLMGFAAMFILSRLGGCNSTLGDSYLMNAIAAAVIGGVSMSGGKGEVVGIFIGTLLIGVVNNALNLLRVPSFWQYVVLGLIIVVAVFVSNLGKKRR